MNLLRLLILWPPFTGRTPVETRDPGILQYRSATERIHYRATIDKLHYRAPSDFVHYRAGKDNDH